MTFMYEKPIAITDGLNRRFPNGNDPFQIIARLLEESGELAKEIMDVLRCALQVALYYDVKEELKQRIEVAHERMCAEGLIDRS
jgi:NTP pyrophosphatase (non-canonical NTP hydrolase)